MKFEDFLSIEVKDNIAIIWIDHKFEKMNVVSPDVMNIMSELFPRIQEDDNIKAAVLISRKPDFMAGADIKAFQIEKEGDFKPFQAEGHKSLERLENSNKPFVAAINGACVGLGTELALACHGRIATNSTRTKMGLPEVQLGILPGGGGTQRLPRLIGIQKALDMMLTGKQLDPRRCKRYGLVDDITDEGKLLQAATMMAKRLIDKPIERKSKLTFVENILQSRLGRGILFSQARKMALKQSQGNYPAIPAILECVETGYKNGITAGYEKELEWFEKLMLTPESAALRSIFFAMNDNKKNPYKGAKKVNKLGIIGAGFMGAGIAEVSATKGINVLLKDIKQEVVDGAYKQIWKSISKRLKRKSLTKIQAEQQIGNVTGELSYTSFDTADVVIEAVLEEMSLKKRIIEDIEKNCNKNVIIASNTSSLSVTEMASHAKKPENVIGMHYFSPVPKMPLLEIVKTDKTADSVIATCYDLGIKQGKTCIVVKDGTGFYVNRILGPYSNECLLMLDEGMAIDVVDKAMVKKGFPVGPITVADQVGLDIVAHVTESSRAAFKDRPGVTISEAVIKMNKDGRKGRKNKKGFYLYDDKGKRKGIDSTAYQYFKGNGDKELPLIEIQDRALMLLFKEAIDCLQDGIIANVKDGDIGAVFGMGFMPFTGGPFRAMDSMGIQNVVNRMYDLHGKYGVRFMPPDVLVKMAEKGENFYK
ncbi:MAG: 3-hydroxyacyl-CoA dehydrogenase NAD-binding domain-containing protein [Saprospiraceae bacterium]